MSVPVGPEPCNMHCTSCNQQITTRIDHRASTKTHIIALLMCLFLCGFCAPCLYCTGCARNVEHYCPKCNAYLGSYDR